MHKIRSKITLKKRAKQQSVASNLKVYLILDSFLFHPDILFIRGDQALKHGLTK